MMKVGIDDLNIYGSTLSIDISEIKSARGFTDKEFNKIRFDRRSVIPTYEDSVTLGINAAKPIVDKAGIDQFALLIVATETGVDYGKPLSSYVHRYLDLKPNCRNFEIKHACYSGTASLQTAVSFLRSGYVPQDKKILLIMTDIGRRHFHELGELSIGAGAVALSISCDPKVFEVEPHSGGAANEVFDTARPTHSLELLDPVLSLCSYLDLLEIAWDEYQQAVGPVVYEEHFAHAIFHTPVTLLVEQAHQYLVETYREEATKDELADSFERMVKPSLRYNRELANVYSGSLYVALAGLLESAPDLQPGSRIGCFSYGSGACAEFFSGLVGQEARATLADQRISEKLAARHSVGLAEYEEAVKGVESGLLQVDFEPTWDVPSDHYEQAYRGQGLLVLDKVSNHYRTYKWS
ncbi:MAG: hydroxymethylglutaryl-CoA synthase [Cyanobacteria bacterium P01_F01_bin.86]